MPAILELLLKIICAFVVEELGTASTYTAANFANQ